MLVANHFCANPFSRRESHTMKLKMTRRRLFAGAAVLIWLAGSIQLVQLCRIGQIIGVARTLDPIVYTVKVPAPETRLANIDVSVPTEKRASIEMMMAVWAPGFYRVEDYAGKVRGVSARAR